MELSPEEIELCREIAFEPLVALTLKKATGNAVERAYQRTEENWEMQPANALASLSTHIQKLPAVREEIIDNYRAYWGIRREKNGLEIGREFVVLKDQDPLAFVKLRRPDGANYDITHEDVLAQLEEWHTLYGIEIVGADHDQVELNFLTLPRDLVSFAEEVYWFCEDIAEPEGDPDEQERDPELFRRTLELPDVSREFAQKYNSQIQEVFDDYQETHFLGIKLLAAHIEKQRSLFLWWD